MLPKGFEHGPPWPKILRHVSLMYNKNKMQPLKIELGSLVPMCEDTKVSHTAHIIKIYQENKYCPRHSNTGKV